MSNEQAAAAVTFTPTTEPPEGAAIVAANGIILGAVFLIQCAECGTALLLEAQNPDHLDQGIVFTQEAICRACTKQAGEGRYVPIAVAALAGEQVEMIEEAPDQAEPAQEPPPPAAAPSSGQA